MRPRLRWRGKLDHRGVRRSIKTQRRGFHRLAVMQRNFRLVSCRFHDVRRREHESRRAHDDATGSAAIALNGDQRPPHAIVALLHARLHAEEFVQRSILRRRHRARRERNQDNKSTGESGRMTFGAHGVARITQRPSGYKEEIRRGPPSGGANAAEFVVKPSQPRARTSGLPGIQHLVSRIQRPHFSKHRHR